MSKRLNGYYSVSVITLVIMGFIFVYELYMQDWFDKNDSQAYQLLKAYSGKYNAAGADSSAWISLRASLQERVITVAFAGRDQLLLKLSDFEDEQVLVEIFDLDSLQQPVRWDACEVLLQKTSDSDYIGESLGELCAYKPDSQSFQRLKINLANPLIRVDIVTRHAEMDTIIQRNTYVLEKEVG